MWGSGGRKIHDTVLIRTTNLAPPPSVLYHRRMSVALLDALLRPATVFIASRSKTVPVYLSVEANSIYMSTSLSHTQSRHCRPNALATSPLLEDFWLPRGKKEITVQPHKTVPNVPGTPSSSMQSPHRANVCRGLGYSGGESPIVSYIDITVEYSSSYSQACRSRSGGEDRKE